jgi:ribosome-associated heat shock protein Hsp15
VTTERQRIDKWLFFARVTKSRSLAAKLAQAGRVRVNGDKVDQASHMVRIGDTLTITLDRQIRILRIAAPGERRGPFEEARLLYDDLTPPPEDGDRLPVALAPVRERGAGRPTKRDRRRIDSWTGGED